MENKMQTLDLFTATAANANLFNEENKVQKAHTRSTFGSTIKNAVQNALKYIEINYGGKALEISADEKGIDIIFSDYQNKIKELFSANFQTYAIYNL